MPVEEATEETTATEVDVSATMPICKVDKRRQMITAIVLEPWDGNPDTADEQSDHDEDVIRAEAIEADAHRFLQGYNRGNRLGYMHEDGEPPLRLCESWIARCDLEFPMPDGAVELVKKGTWLMTLYVADPVMWAAVESGELDGLSIGGTGTRTPV